MRGLKGKRFLVAGGANGMGAATVERLLAEGASVFIGDVDANGVETLVTRLERDDAAIAGAQFDLADEATIVELIRRAVDFLGGLDGVAITAADLSKATLGNDVGLDEMDPRIWDRTLRVNLTGHALLMKAVLPHLREAGGGAIVTTSSGAAHMGSAEMPAYAASKAGLHALVRHTARIAGRQNVRCNGIAPGLVLTPGAMVNMTEEMRQVGLDSIALPALGTPDDMAGVFVFLLSDDARWLTGQVISVNGGSNFRD